MSLEHHFRGNCYRHCNVIFVTFNQTTGRVIRISPSIGTIPPACENDTSIQDLTVRLLKDGYTIQAFYQETFVFSKCKSYYDTK